MREIICIGHITHDHIVTPLIDLHIPGGTAWYFAWGMHALAQSDDAPVSPYRLITAVGPDDMPVSYTHLRAPTICRPSISCARPVCASR